MATAVTPKKTNYVRIIRNVLFIAALAGLVLYFLNSNKAKREAAVEKQDPNVAVAVSVAPVQRDVLQSSLSIVGTVFANNDITLISETAGRITEMYVDVGSNLQPGTVILKVDDELRRAAYITADAAYDQAKKDLERYEKLYETKSITAQQIEGARLQVKQAQANFIVAQRNLSDTQVKSPIAGTLTTRLVNVGNTLGQGSPIGNIVDVRVLKVKVNVPETDVFRLAQNQAVEITSDVYPKAVFTGYILNISPKSDEAHTVAVEVRLQNNPSLPLKAGMFARVNFKNVKRAETLVIPRAALVGSVRDASVYLVQNGKAILRKVVIGSEEDQRLEVLQGLNENDSVVIDGQINLQDGAKVSINKK
jgi:RND family efflux transporter MFP subunit